MPFVVRSKVAASTLVLSISALYPYISSARINDLPSLNLGAAARSATHSSTQTSVDQLLAQRGGRGTPSTSQMTATCSVTPKPPSVTSSDGNEKWRIIFDSWMDDSLHWTAPSYLSVCYGGSVALMIAHAANMRRTGQISDQGTMVCAKVKISFFDDSKCNGEPFYVTPEVEFFCLGYKREVFSHKYIRGGNVFAPAVERASCVKAERIWQSPFGK